MYAIIRTFPTAMDSEHENADLLFPQVLLTVAQLYPVTWEGRR